MLDLIILQCTCGVWAERGEGKMSIDCGLLIAGEPVVILGNVAKTGWRSNWVNCLTRNGICLIHSDYLHVI